MHSHFSMDPQLWEGQCPVLIPSSWSPGTALGEFPQLSLLHPFCWYKSRACLWPRFPKGIHPEHSGWDLGLSLPASPQPQPWEAVAPSLPGIPVPSGFKGWDLGRGDPGKLPGSSSSLLPAHPRAEFPLLFHPSTSQGASPVSPWRNVGLSGPTDPWMTKFPPCSSLDSALWHRVGFWDGLVRASSWIRDSCGSLPTRGIPWCILEIPVCWGTGEPFGMGIPSCRGRDWNQSHFGWQRPPRSKVMFDLNL